MLRVKFYFKWAFVFLVLSMWTLLIFYSIEFSSAEVSEAGDVNVPLYLETEAGIEKINSIQIFTYLFFRDFEIEERIEVIPIKDCSLRASGGLLQAGNMNFDDRGEGSLNINYLANGKGSLTAQKDRNRFSLGFEAKNITKTNLQELSFIAEGDGRINRAPFTPSEIIVSFDKQNNMVSITDNSFFAATNMDVDFIEGCLTEEIKFNLLIDKGELSSQRSIGEVRQALNENPEFMDANEKVEKLFKEPYWWNIVPIPLAFVS